MYQSLKDRWWQALIVSHLTSRMSPPASVYQCTSVAYHKSFCAPLACASRDTRPSPPNTVYRQQYTLCTLNSQLSRKDSELQQWVYRYMGVRSLLHGQSHIITCLQSRYFLKCAMIILSIKHNCIHQMDDEYHVYQTSILKRSILKGLSTLLSYERE